jgi:hypothetical protein
MPVIDVSGDGSTTIPGSIPHDWTEGTGVFPTGGVITVPAPPLGFTRKWFLVQNQGPTAITLSFQAKKATGAAATANILLAQGAGAGTQGAADERGGSVWNTCGTVVITGVAGDAVLVLEVLG